MASLNTLRTKFGIVLSIVIAGALLAFILSLKTEMGFSGNDPRVGVIDGEKINYSEYYNQYEQVKAQSGAQESNEQQSAMLANAAWQALIGKYVLTPGFDKMGLRVTEPERMSMVSGSILRRLSTMPSRIPARVSTTSPPFTSSSPRPKPTRRRSRLGRSSTSRPAWSARSPSSSA